MNWLDRWSITHRKQWAAVVIICAAPLPAFIAALLLGGSLLQALGYSLIVGVLSVPVYLLASRYLYGRSDDLSEKGTDSRRES